MPLGSYTKMPSSMSPKNLGNKTEEPAEMARKKVPKANNQRLAGDMYRNRRVDWRKLAQLNLLLGRSRSSCSRLDMRTKFRNLGDVAPIVC